MAKRKAKRSKKRPKRAKRATKKKSGNGNWTVAIIIVIILIAGILFLSSRGVELPGAPDGPGEAPTGPAATPRNTLTLNLVNVQPLDAGHLEGWAIFGEEKVSTGKFNVGDPLTFTSSRDLNSADMKSRVYGKGRGLSGVGSSLYPVSNGSSSSTMNGASYIIRERWHTPVPSSFFASKIPIITLAISWGS